MARNRTQENKVSKYIRRGDVAGAKRELLKIVDINACDENGRTFLHDAIDTVDHMDDSQRKDLVRIILGNGASVNQQTNLGQTPLILVAQQGKVSLIETIKEFNPELNMQQHVFDQDKYNEYYTEYKRSQNNVDSRKRLERPTIEQYLPEDGKGKGDTALMVAARNGHTEAVVALLGIGADKDIENYHFESALDLASEPGMKVVLSTDSRYNAR